MFQHLRNTFCWYTWTLQGLMIHQGLKIIHVLIHKHSQHVTVNIESRELRWLGDQLMTLRYLFRIPWDGLKICLFFEKWLVSKIASVFNTHVRLFFQNEQIKSNVVYMHILGDRSRGSQTFCISRYSLDQWCRILILSGSPSALHLFQVSSGDFTTVEMNAIERTLNNSCSQSLARKRDSWKLEIMFSKHFSSGWI